MPKIKKLSTAEAKEKALDCTASGMTRTSTLQLIGRSISTWEEWRRSDPEWAKKIDSLREGIASARQRGVDGGNQGLSFAAWRKKFLGQDTFRHQQAWVDLLEGRPYTPVEGETYEPADPNRLIINVPPFHCAEVSTPVLTADGWKTIGEVSEDDFLVGDNGELAPVFETWEPDGDVDLFRVRFTTGDEIVTDAGHLWEVSGTQGPRRLMSTAELMARPRYSGIIRWRVHMARPVEMPERDLPLDPYLFGYWIGDGDRDGSRFACADEDLPHLQRELESAGFTHSVSRDGRDVAQVYAHRMRSLLPLGSKKIPEEYLLGSQAQRLALLQGLMDSDGTINPKDGRASFVQVDERIARDVYRLVASLGMQPRIRHEKQGATAPNGRPGTERIWRVYFKPNGQAVFRLPRKARHLRVTGAGAKTNNRTIESVTPAGRGRVRCITVLSDGNKFLIGDGLIPTHNAKSTTLSIEYVTYRICMNPNVRVIIVSKRVDQARKFLYSIKQRLTSNQWAPLQAAYAPEGGFKPNRYDGATWGADRIYVNGIDSGEKDPTVEALGLGGQIYGSRADLIIIDDGIVSSNASQYESQITWLESEVENRAFDGKILVIGTRLATTDLYSELPRGDRYLSGRSPWTVLRQPAVLAYAEDPKDWVTLWPRTTRPMETGQSPDADGTYEAWDGPRLNRVRDAKPPRVWSLVYQQAEVADDATFDPLCVNGSVDRRRKPGPLIAGAWGHPRNGAEGQYVIASMDPAMAGDTFTLVGSVDRTTKIRRVLNCWVQTSPTPAYIRGLIRDVTEEFGVHEWVIEQNAFQLFLVHDEAIQEYCRNRGVRITPHYCVDTETEVLSKRGWLRSGEVRVGDQILTLNIETEMSEWKPVLEVYRGRYSGKMHRYDHRNIDALCTPDHKWIRTDQKFGPMRLVESRNLNTNSVLPLARPLDVSGDVESEFSDDMVELVGWSVTEGHYRKKWSTITLSQSERVNPEKCQQIRGVLERLGARWSERDNGTGNGVRAFSFSGPVAKAVRAITGDRKYLDPGFVASLPERQRKILFEVLVAADGWRSRRSDCFCSDESSLVTAFEMLSAMSGFPTHTREHASDPGHFQSRRKSYNNSFLQNVATRPVEVEWSGDIWCPRTQNGTFYARRNGKAYFTGNTSRNKQDPDFGVASVAPLFGSTRRINEGAGRAVHAGDNLIWLPDPDKSVGVKTLIEELVAWQPGKLGKQLRQDGPMALWFFELRARAILLGADGSGSRKPFMDNPYLSRGDRRNQVVVPVDFLKRAYA